MPDPRPIDDVCPVRSTHELVDGQYVRQEGRDPECMAEQCPQRTHILVDGAYVQHCVVPDAPAPADPATDTTAEPTDDEAQPDANAEESQVPDRFSMGSLRLEGHMGYPSFIRSLSPIYQPTLGIGGHASVTMPGGAQLFGGYRYEHLTIDSFAEERPAGHDTTEAINSHDIHLGLEGAHQLFRLGQWGRVRYDQSDAIVIRIQNNEFSEGATAFGVERFIGASVDLSQYFSLGVGLLEYSELGGQGPNRLSYNPSLGLRLSGNFSERPVEFDGRGQVPLRIWRIAGTVPHILQNVETTSHVTGVDGQRSLAPVLALFNAPNYGIMATNIANLGIDNMPNRTGTMAYGITAMLLGAGLEIGGIAGDLPAMTGIGGATFCGGAGTIPTMAGSNDIWANRGTLIGCGALQAGIGTILFFTAPSLDTGTDNPIQYAPGGPSEVDPSANPHLDVTAERRVENAYQLWSVGAGTGVFGPFGVSVNLRRNSEGISGASATVSGRF